MKKKVLSMLLCLTMLGTMAGCQSKEPAVDSSQGEGTITQQETSSGPVELNVWAEGDNFDMLNGMIETFKQQYPGQEINITLTEMADADVRDVMLGNVHEGADVFHFPDDQLNSLIAGGVLSAVPNSDEVKAANTAESVTAASLNEELYSYPMTADNGYFLYYDKRYFSEEDVKTLDKILEVAAAAEKKFSMELNSGWYLYSFFGNTGLQMGLNDDGVTNFCNWNTTEGSVKGIDVGNALVSIVSHPGFISQPNGDFITGVQDGSVIAGISGVWHAVNVQEAWGSNCGAVKLPTYTLNGSQVQMASFTGYKMVGVNSYSEHLDWAHKFANWITNEENQQIRFEMRSQGPSNINVAASDEVMKVPAIAAVIDQSQYGVLQRVGNNYWTPTTDFANTLVEKKPLGADLQSALDLMVEGVTASTAG